MVVFTTNIRRKRIASNPLLMDPTRSKLLRRQWEADFNRRFEELQRRLFKLVVEEDAFGLIVTNVRKWKAKNDPAKVAAFTEWLESEIEDLVVGSEEEKEEAYWKQYSDRAYQKGTNRAYEDTKKTSAWGAGEGDFQKGTKAEFMRESFGRPVTIEKLKAFSARIYDDLDKVTTEMSDQMRKVLVEGLARGDNPHTIARALNDRVDKIGQTRATVIARTEITRIHAEAQLDTFERLGVDEIGVMVEWDTAGDDRVCPLCQPMDGVVLTIKEARGIIPRHPQCRCAHTPANVGELASETKRVNFTDPDTGEVVTKHIKQTRGQAALDRARDASIRAEIPKRAGKRTVARQKNLSQWKGANTKFARTRPKSILDGPLQPISGPPEPISARAMQGKFNRLTTLKNKPNKSDAEFDEMLKLKKETGGDALSKAKAKIAAEKAAKKTPKKKLDRDIDDSHLTSDEKEGLEELLLSAKTEGKKMTSGNVAEFMDRNTEGRIDVQDIKRRLEKESKYFVSTDVDISRLKGLDDIDVDLTRAVPAKGEIIVGRDGFIYDGRHRAAFARAKGQKTIKAWVPIEVPGKKVAKKAVTAVTKKVVKKKGAGGQLKALTAGKDDVVIKTVQGKGLPDGWFAQSLERKSGKRYKIYISPDDENYKTLAAAKKAAGVEAKKTAKKTVKKTAVTTKKAKRAKRVADAKKNLAATKAKIAKATKAAKTTKIKTTKGFKNMELRKRLTTRGLSPEMDEIENIRKKIVAIEDSRILELKSLEDELSKTSREWDIKYSQYQRETHEYNRLHPRGSVDPFNDTERGIKLLDITDDLQDDIIGLEDEIIRLRKPGKKAAHKLLELAEEEQMQIGIRTSADLSAGQKAGAEAVSKWATKITKKRKLFSTIEPAMKPASGNRSSWSSPLFSQNGTINLGSAKGQRSIAHELGHEIESIFRHSGSRRDAVTFRTYRVVDAQTPTINLGQKFPQYNFRADETGNEDSWGKLFAHDSSKETSPFYIGKTYSSGHTEVISMGFERLFEDPTRLAKLDPEFFNLIVGILRGAL
jgi:SPP1 gp7 family putative phage head morphogenesis protein